MHARNKPRMIRMDSPMSVRLRDSIYLLPQMMSVWLLRKGTRIKSVFINWNRQDVHKWTVDWVSDYIWDFYLMFVFVLLLLSRNLRWVSVVSENLFTVHGLFEMSKELEKQYDLLLMRKRGRCSTAAVDWIYIYYLLFDTHWFFFPFCYTFLCFVLLLLCYLFDCYIRFSSIWKTNISKKQLWAHIQRQTIPVR